MTQLNVQYCTLYTISVYSNISGHTNFSRYGMFLNPSFYNILKCHWRISPFLTIKNPFHTDRADTILKRVKLPYKVVQQNTTSLTFLYILGIAEQTYT